LFLVHESFTDSTSFKKRGSQGVTVRLSECDFLRLEELATFLQSLPAQPVNATPYNQLI